MGGHHTWEGHVEDVGVIGVPGDVLRCQLAGAQVVIQQAQRVEAPLHPPPAIHPQKFTPMLHS